MRSHHALRIESLLGASAALALLTVGCTDTPEGPTRSIFEGSRASVPWEVLVDQRQAAYAEDPGAAEFARSSTSWATSPVYSAAETDPVDATLVEWVCSSNGEPDEFDTMWMEVIAQTVAAGATPYVYLDTWVEGDDDDTVLDVCSGMLKTQHGVQSDQVQWIQQYASDAAWIRDFGPFFVREVDDEALSIEDALYYPGRPNDDDEPKDFAARMGVPVSDFNLYYEGGNFLPNGGGLCIASSVVVDANPQYTEDEIRTMFHEELGCAQLVIVQALDDWATGHVDMWLAWANQSTLLVGEYERNQDPTNEAIIEDNVEDYLSDLTDPESGEPITLVRIPMPSNCPDPEWAHIVNLAQSHASDTGWTNGAYRSQVASNPNYWTHVRAPQSCPHIPAWGRIWRTYLNVMPVNGTVLVPVYTQDPSREEEALQIWRDQGLEVVPVTVDQIAPMAGTIHCLTKTLPSARP